MKGELKKLEKLNNKRRKLKEESDAILQTSGVGQVPPCFYKVVDKEIVVCKKMAIIWNNIRSTITKRGNTLWQEAIKQNKDVVYFGKETMLKLTYKDITGLI